VRESGLKASNGHRERPLTARGRRLPTGNRRNAQLLKFSPSASASQTERPRRRGRGRTGKPLNRFEPPPRRLASKARRARSEINCKFAVYSTAHDFGTFGRLRLTHLTTSRTSEHSARPPPRRRQAGKNWEAPEGASCRRQGGASGDGLKDIAWKCLRLELNPRESQCSRGFLSAARCDRRRLIYGRAITGPLRDGNRGHPVAVRTANLQYGRLAKSGVAAARWAALKFPIETDGCG
jgi:hypothetical protein